MYNSSLNDFIVLKNIQYQFIHKYNKCYIRLGDDGCSPSLVYRYRVEGVADLFDHRVETIAVIGCVLDKTNGSIGFVEAVRTSDKISIPDFMLAFDVPSDRIVNSVVKTVTRETLRMVKTGIRKKRK